MIREGIDTVKSATLWGALASSIVAGVGAAGFIATGVTGLSSEVTFRNPAGDIIRYQMDSDTFGEMAFYGVWTTVALIAFASLLRFTHYIPNLPSRAVAASE